MLFVGIFSCEVRGPKSVLWEFNQRDFMDLNYAFQVTVHLLGRKGREREKPSICWALIKFLEPVGKITQ